MRWLRDRPLKLLLTAGALAGAIASIIGLTGTVQSYFNGPAEGSVRVLTIKSVNTLNYGEWRTHEHGGTKGVPAKQLGLPGWLISFDVNTSGFAKNTTLPVQLIRHDVSTHRSTNITGDPISVLNGADCGCTDWVLIPHVGHKYYVEIAIFPPGPINGSPLRTDATAVFSGRGP